MKKLALYIVIGLSLGISSVNFAVGGRTRSDLIGHHRGAKGAHNDEALRHTRDIGIAVKASGLMSTIGIAVKEDDLEEAEYQDLYLVPSAKDIGKYAHVRVWQGKNIIVDLVPNEGETKNFLAGVRFLIALKLPWNEVKMVWTRIPEAGKEFGFNKYPQSSYIGFDGRPLGKRKQSHYEKKLESGKIAKKDLHVVKEVEL